jgi:serine/threonine-protein kinase
LNHPNILTIYEIGQAESARYIATEFVEGLTLREFIQERPLAIASALDVAVQVAGALAAVRRPAPSLAPDAMQPKFVSI